MLIKILLNLLRKLVDDINTGNSNITEEDATSITDGMLICAIKESQLIGKKCYEKTNYKY